MSPTSYQTAPSRVNESIFFILTAKYIFARAEINNHANLKFSEFGALQTN